MGENGKDRGSHRRRSIATWRVLEACRCNQRRWCALFLCQTGGSKQLPPLKATGKNKLKAVNTWRGRGAASGIMIKQLLLASRYSPANEYALRNFARILWLISITVPRRPGGDGCFSRRETTGLRRICNRRARGFKAIFRPPFLD